MHAKTKSKGDSLNSAQSGRWGVRILTGLVLLASVLLTVQFRQVSGLRHRLEEQTRLQAIDAAASEAAGTYANQAVSDGLPDDSRVNELRSANEALLARFEELETKTADREPSMPGHEKPETAYFGPGKWVRGDWQSVWDEVTIQGTSTNDIRISLGGVAAWEATPLRPVRYTNRYIGKSFQRFWGESPVKGINETNQILVTFESDGLRVDWLRVRDADAGVCLFASKLKRVIE